MYVCMYVYRSEELVLEGYSSHQSMRNHVGKWGIPSPHSPPGRYISYAPRQKLPGAIRRLNASNDIFWLIVSRFAINFKVIFLEMGT